MIFIIVFHLVLKGWQLNTWDRVITIDNSRVISTERL